jgi:hypothetical protein
MLIVSLPDAFAPSALAAARLGTHFVPLRHGAALVECRLASVDSVSHPKVRGHRMVEQVEVQDVGTGAVHILAGHNARRLLHGEFRGA